MFLEDKNSLIYYVEAERGNGIIKRRNQKVETHENNSSLKQMAVARMRNCWIYGCATCSFFPVGG